MSLKPQVRALHNQFYDSIPTWVNGTQQFGSLLRKYLRPEMTVLNLGAGLGVGRLHFDSEASTVVGIDPDPGIERNQRLTSRVRASAEDMPFRNDVFDLVYMDWVVEHLPSPERAVREVFRVLKNHGRLLFRTGNLFHYSYAIARFTPHSFHEFLLNGKTDVEPYPTYYRMNTLGAVRRTMAKAGFSEEEILLMEPDPAYVGMMRATFLAGVLYERLVNRHRVFGPLRANILGCYRKPG